MTELERSVPSVKKENNSEEDEEEEEDLFGGDDEEDEGPESSNSSIVKVEQLSKSSLVSSHPSIERAKIKESANVLGAEKQQEEKAESLVPTIPHVNTGIKSEEFAPEPPIISTYSATTGSEEYDGNNPGTSSALDDETSPIPRKNNLQNTSSLVAGVQSPSPLSSPVAAPRASQTTTKYYSGARFGLAPAVKIPESVDSKLLEGTILTKLKSLPANLANDALQEYDDALQIKGSSIRNQGAYLFGVIKRYVSVQDRANSGEGPAILPMGEGLTPLVNARLETLVASGFCSREEMNDKVKSKIRMLSEKDALFAIDELSSAERATIRNFGSYFMGILNRYMRGDTSARGTNASSSNRANRFDRTHTLPSASGERSFRDSSTKNHSDRLRDRSRDRNDSHRSRSYGNAGVGDRAVHPRSSDPYAGNTSNRWQQQQHQTRQPTSMVAVATFNNSNNGMMGNGMGGVPPPPPPPNMGLPNNPYMHQQQLQTPYIQQQHQQANPYSGGQQGYTSLGENLQQPQILGQNFNNTSMVHQPNNNFHLQPVMAGQPPSYNNMGGQPQPNHFVPQQQQQSYNPIAGTGQMPPQQPQPGSYASWQQQPQPHQQQFNQVPVDILALADKASSALLAVSQQQNKMMMGVGHPYSSSTALNHHAPAPPPPPPSLNGMPSNPYSKNSEPAQQQQTVGNNQRNSTSSVNRPPRHTTATIQDLPTSVQYAVENLIMTGQVEKAPDDGIMGMIYDLPESLALSALQKFTAIDKTGMRSRIAYLAGVLRRELEKINKR